MLNRPDRPYPDADREYCSWAAPRLGPKLRKPEELRTLKAEQEIAARKREERGEEGARGRGGEAREDREEHEEDGRAQLLQGVERRA